MSKGERRDRQQDRVRAQPAHGAPDQEPSEVELPAEPVGQEGRLGDPEHPGVVHSGLDFFEDMALSVAIALRRKQAEDDLRESERKSHAIFDQAFALIGLLTPYGTLLDINRAALELAGI